jgi:hypothetical protein
MINECNIYEAYLRVHARAFLSCSFLLVFNNLAISATKGSLGLGSVNNEHTDNNTFDIVNAGDQLSFKISKQMPPASLMLQWYTLVSNCNFGGLNG